MSSFTAPVARKKISRTRAARIYLAHEGQCGICGRLIRPGEPWDADHAVPLWDGGADDDSNLRPVHVACHAAKTGEEAPQRAKRNRHITASFKGEKSSARGFRKPPNTEWDWSGPYARLVRVSHGPDRDAQTEIERGEK